MQKGTQEVKGAAINPKAGVTFLIIKQVNTCHIKFKISKPLLMEI